MEIKAVLNVQDLRDVLHAKRLTLVDGQGLGGPDCVLDLATVKIMFCQTFIVTLGEGLEVNLLENTDSLYEDLENSFFSLLGETVVSQGNVNT